MKILMATNTYLNVVGGLEKSVQSFARKFRSWGHEVLIAGPDFVGLELEEGEGERARSPKSVPHPLTNSTFSLSLPFRAHLERKIAEFNPDIIHTHHPFLMGEMALRFSAYYDKPVVFTYHIMFDQYAHYLPSVSTSFSKEFLTVMASGFCDLTTRVIAPSESVKEILQNQGVCVPIDVVPTGIEISQYSQGNRESRRKELGLNEDAVLLGYVGRLAPEKNLEFLAKNAVRFMLENKTAHFLVVGKGPAEDEVKNIFDKAGISERVHMVGALQGQSLADCYHAMDIFIFASKSETQGLVLCEAMAAGIPVVALDAPGVREVLRDFQNGRLVPKEDDNAFQSALAWCATQSTPELIRLSQNARKTAAEFTTDQCAERALKAYHLAQKDWNAGKLWPLRCLITEFKILKNIFRAVALALKTLFFTKPAISKKEIMKTALPLWALIILITLSGCHSGTVKGLGSDVSRLGDHMQR